MSAVTFLKKSNQKTFGHALVLVGCAAANDQRRSVEPSSVQIHGASKESFFASFCSQKEVLLFLFSPDNAP
jgi:hypothetical protein